MYVYHSFALFLQETRDWNTEYNIAFRTPVTTKITKQMNFTQHSLRNTEAHTRAELISFTFLSQFSLTFWQEQGCPFSFGFENRPLPTLLKITLINGKKAPTVHACSKLTQAYNILLLSMFLRTVWWAADLSPASYKHIALMFMKCPSLISCTYLCGAN